MPSTPPPLRVLSVSAAPVLAVEYRNASHGGGVHTARLPIVAGEVEGLPPALDALVLTSDLQGRVPPSAAAAHSAGSHPVTGDEPPLLGEVVAAQLAEAGLVDPARTGVVLAGDLYAHPDLHARGATGDVRLVWRAFAAHARWVAGVPGNHDQLGAPEDERRRFGKEPGIHDLDGQVVTLDGLRLAGVGGVIGRPRRDRPHRREAAEHAALVARLAGEGVDLLVLHEAPRMDGKRLSGSGEVRSALEAAWGAARPGLVVCGHKHWPRPLGELAGGQVLNVDGRVVVLARSG